MHTEYLFNTARFVLAARPCGKKLGMSCLDTGTLKYKCNCPPGYSSSGNPLTCNLVNACQASEDDCVTGPSRNFLRVNTDSACKTKLALPRPTAAPTAALALQRHHC